LIFFPDTNNKTIMKRQTQSLSLDIIPFDDRSQQHPQHSQLPDWIPKHEFLMLIVAPAGSGKTTLLLNLLLRIYTNYWHRIYIFSPTIHNDAKWDHVRQAKNILMKPQKDGSYLKDANESTATEGDTNETTEQSEDKWLPEWAKKDKSKIPVNERRVDALDKHNGRKGAPSKMNRFSKKRGPALAPLRVMEREKQTQPPSQGKQLSEEEAKELLIQKMKRQHFYIQQMQPRMSTLQEDMLRDYKEYMLRIPPTMQKPTTTDKWNMTEDEIRKTVSRSSKQTTDKKNNNSSKERKILEQDMKDEYSEATLDKMMKQQQKRSDELFNQSGDRSNYIQELPKKMERLCWVFDDMVGSGLFSNKRDNAFKRLTVRRRHLYSSIIGVTQAYREIPKTTRTNSNCLILFHIDNEEELATIYQEFPMGMKWHEWIKVVTYVTTRTPFSFITFNLQTSDPNRRIIMDLSEPLDTTMLQHIIHSTNFQ
jgi:energy-coupling factor transporter ATP-binding protein EcfA2